MAIEKLNASSSLAEVIDRILDKGIVVDAWARVSLVGIELLTIDARIVIASVDTYLRFAEATNRLDLYEHGGKDLPELFGAMQEGGAEHKTKGALSGVKDKVSNAIGGSDDDDDDDADSGGSRSRPRRAPASGGRRRRKEADE